MGRPKTVFRSLWRQLSGNPGSLGVRTDALRVGTTKVRLMKQSECKLDEYSLRYGRSRASRHLRKDFCGHRGRLQQSSFLQRVGIISTRLTLQVSSRKNVYSPRYRHFLFLPPAHGEDGQKCGPLAASSYLLNLLLDFSFVCARKPPSSSAPPAPPLGAAP